MQRSTKIFSPTLTSSVPLQRLHTRRQMVIRRRRRSRNTAMPHLMSQCSFSGSLISKLPIWIPNNTVAPFIWFCWGNPQLPGCSFFIQGSWILLKFCFLHYLALSCSILHYLALSCTILHYLTLSCTIFHYLALSYTVLHYLALSCTILQYLTLSCSDVLLYP